MRQTPHIGPEDMEEKIRKAQDAVWEDVTVEELKQEWLRTSGLAGRHDAPSDAKEKARIAKQKYFEALEKEAQKSN